MDDAKLKARAKALAIRYVASIQSILGGSDSRREKQRKMHVAYRKALRDTLQLLLPRSHLVGSSMRGLMTFRHAPPQPESMLSAWKLPRMEGIATLACWLLRRDTEAPPDSEMTFLYGSGPNFDAWELQQFKPSCYGTSLRGWAAFIDATPTAARPPPPPPPPPSRAPPLQPLPQPHAALPSSRISTAGPEHRDLNVIRRPRQRAIRGEGVGAGQQVQAAARTGRQPESALYASSPPPPVPRAPLPCSAAAAVPERGVQAPSAGGAGCARQRLQRGEQGQQSQEVMGPVPAATGPAAFFYAPPPPPPRQPPPPSPPPRVVDAAANATLKPLEQAIPHAGTLGQRTRRTGRAQSSEQPAPPGLPRTPSPTPPPILPSSPPSATASLQSVDLASAPRASQPLAADKAKPDRSLSTPAAAPREPLVPPPAKPLLPTCNPCFNLQGLQQPPRGASCHPLLPIGDSAHFAPHLQPRAGASPDPLLPILDPAFELQDLPLPEPPHFALAAEERDAAYAVLYGALALPWIRGEGTYQEVVQAVRRQQQRQLRRQEGGGGAPKLHALQEYFRVLLRAWQEHAEDDPGHHGFLQTLEDNLWWYYGVELPACWSVRQYVKGRYGTEALKAVREGEYDDAPVEGAWHCAPRASREAALELLRLVRGLAGSAAGGDEYGQVVEELSEVSAVMATGLKVEAEAEASL